VTSWERNYDHNDCDSERDEKKEKKPGLLILAGELTNV